MERFSENKELDLLCLAYLVGGLAHVFGAFIVFYIGDLAYHADPMFFGIYLICTAVAFATLVRRTRDNSTHSISRHPNIAT